MSAGTALESVLKRDRAVVVGALATVIIASWLYLLAGAGTGMDALEMTGRSGAAEAGAGGVRGAAMTLVTPAAWTPAYAVLMFFMWWVMMLAMMLPSASPMILLQAAIARQATAAPAAGSTLSRTACFTAGYLVAWGAFSAAATTAQWGLERSALLSGMMASTSAALGGGLLIAAGVYQLTPLKHACLRHCRSPLHFVATHWKDGAAGAFRMGARHGLFCLGCCWFLMLLLFYGGVMNLYWIIGLAVFVLLEKSIPAGHWLGRVTGFALAGWGVGVLTLGE